jgi:hypothetical protein
MAKQKKLEVKEKVVFLKKKKTNEFFKGQSIIHKTNDNKEHNYGTGIIKEFCNNQEYIQCNFDNSSAINPVVVRVDGIIKNSSRKLKENK